MFHCGASKSLGKKAAVLVAAMVTALAGIGVTSSPANAINRVSCGDRDDFLKLLSDATTCWANAGTAKVKLYRVSAIFSGNNAGYIQGYGPWTRTSFRKWVCMPISKRTITKVHIK
ncbi:MAG: hypothetical protein QG597_1279 [Actinomycetota bacterium]|nr:hypothetical protein [Actinomycetota bacterium]